MKKNKKLFLASIAAMGAVAIGTGAVSTFAWYKVDTTVNAVGGNDSQALTSNVTMSGQNETETFSISFNEIYYTSTAGTPGENNYVLTNWKTYTTEAASARNSGKLQLVHQGGSSLEHYYVGLDGKLHSYAGEAGLVDYAMYEVKITIQDTTSLPAATVASQLSGKYASVNLTATGTNDDRIKAEFLTSPSALAYNTASFTADVETKAIANSTSAQVIGYLIVWFDGGDIGAGNGATAGYQNDYSAGNTQLSASINVAFSNLHTKP